MRSVMFKRSIDLSEYIIYKRNRSNIPETTPMHVQKLAYLCHGWTLGLESKPLIHELVEAWRYGPVIPSIYHAYKPYGAEHIELDFQNNSQLFKKYERGIIDSILDLYWDYSAFDLSAITHLSGSPWEIIYNSKGEGAPIPNKLIKEYYSDLAEEDE